MGGGPSPHPSPSLEIMSPIMGAAAFLMVEIRWEFPICEGHQACLHPGDHFFYIALIYIVHPGSPAQRHPGTGGEAGRCWLCWARSRLALSARARDVLLATPLSWSVSGVTGSRARAFGAASFLPLLAALYFGVPVGRQPPAMIWKWMIPNSRSPYKLPKIKRGFSDRVYNYLLPIRGAGLVPYGWMRASHPQKSGLFRQLLNDGVITC